MVTFDLQSLLGTFFEEAEEHLASFEQGLLELDANPEDAEVIARIFRAAHSIKGASGTFGLNDIMGFTHALESLFDRLRQGELRYEPVLGATLLESLDMLKILVARARNGEDPPLEVSALKKKLLSFVPSRTAAPPVVVLDGPQNGRRVEVQFRPKAAFMSRGMDPVRTLRDVLSCGELETCELDASAVPVLEDLDPTTMMLAWRVVLSTELSRADIADVFMFVDDLCSFEITDVPDEAAPAAPAAALDPAANAPSPKPAARAANGAAVAEASTIRVATDRIDMLLDLVGELVIAQAMIVEASRSKQEGSGARLEEALAMMERHTRDLQERVMSIRMVPLATVFRRFPRLVHDTAHAVGKKVKLEIQGEGTEIDKSMVEKLVDPLTHLVRNAIDHGLEEPAERLACGKSEEGTVTLSALHQGGNVVIEISDDGRGLDGAKIRAKAERLGLLSPTDVITDEQLHEFIFHAGFSTASAVSDLSGRGVGMDVVKRNVELLNGSLTLTTERNKGTRLRLRLPLTLAILDGLSVRVGTQTFIVPLLSVVESFRPAPGQVRGIFGVPEVIDVRGVSLPIVRMHEVLGVPHAQTDATKALVCIVETNDGNVALLVDDVLGQLQVVVKSLETNFEKVDALMGATILGDGRVAMIVDVQALSRRGVVPMNDRMANTQHRSVEF
ncbi:MAG: cheA [Labilithrix sp.]|nr:cheA [Labilithrix sp.]